MKSLTENIGGVLIAAAAAIIFFAVCMGDSVQEKWKEGAKKEDKSVEYKETFEQAVLSYPVLTYAGSMTRQTGETCNIAEEVFLENGKEKSSLKQAVEKKEWKCLDIKVLKNGEIKTADAVINIDAGNIVFLKSGVYEVQVSGADIYNNTAEIRFYLMINRKGETV